MGGYTVLHMESFSERLILNENFGINFYSQYCLSVNKLFHKLLDRFYWNLQDSHWMHCTSTINWHFESSHVKIAVTVNQLYIKMAITYSKSPKMRSNVCGSRWRSSLTHTLCINTSHEMWLWWTSVTVVLNYYSVIKGDRRYNSC